MAIAEVEHLTVRYGRKTALHDFTASIPSGCVGLLGPNGAGKSTLLKTLLGFVKPAAGTARILDLDVRGAGAAVRRRIGLMPEVECHIPGINAVTFVAYAGELSGMPAAQALRRAHEVLEYCGLGEARYRAIDGYSTGMKQRIKLAQAMVHGPSLLMLDEPTNGLDPEGRDDMLRLVRDISHGKGVNVLVTSHLLPDIEQTCDHVIVMKGGQVAAQGEVARLRRPDEDHYDAELRTPSDLFARAVAEQGGRVVSSMGPLYRIQLPRGVEAMPMVFSLAQQTGNQLRGFKPAHRSLEDIFLQAIE